MIVLGVLQSRQNHEEMFRGRRKLPTSLTCPFSHLKVPHLSDFANAFTTSAGSQSPIVLFKRQEAVTVVVALQQA
jgi:hypothetical protein